MSLLYRITKQDDWNLVFLKGKINEDAGGPLNDLLEKIGPKCILNLKEIDEINSLGVRTWVRFIREFELTRSVIFEECTPEVIDQINMIPDFKGKSVIKSLYARYVCEDCGNKTLHLFKTDENMPKGPIEGPVLDLACSNCGKKMEMEELESEFFACMMRS